MKYDAFRADPAAYSGTRVVLFFHAGWCPDCRRTDENLTAQRASIPKDLTVVKVDYDTRTDLRTSYGVVQQHTFVAIDADGAKRSIWTGTDTVADILPLLPVIVGRTIIGADATRAATTDGGRAAVRSAVRSHQASSGLSRALGVTAGLGLSVVALTLLLKGTTLFITVPRQVWQTVSRGVLLLLGVIQVRPHLWDAGSTRLEMGARAGTRLSTARTRGGRWGDVLTGAALGPVFSSCSPLYAYVVVTARRALGLLLMAVGLLVLTGADRSLQTRIVSHSPVQPWNLDAGFLPDGTR